MPELPEMENYRQRLQGSVCGLRVRDVEITRERSINVAPTAFVDAVGGSTVTGIARRAKHLIFQIETGNVLLLHLMLGGWLYLGDSEDRPDHTAQITLSFSNGRSLYFVGLRLGYLHLLSADAARDRLEALGPEPFDLSEEQFRSRLSARRAPLKTVLVNQSVLAGIGNCYADELCFEARIQPLRRIQELSDTDFPQLYDAMRAVLREATVRGGYMEHPFCLGDTITGGYNSSCRVYDCKDVPCPRCGAPILQTEHAGRKVFYCGACQR